MINNIFTFDEDNDECNCGQYSLELCKSCKKKYSHKDKLREDIDYKSAPPVVGKCPKCSYGDLVVYFGTLRYCNRCTYWE